MNKVSITLSAVAAIAIAACIYLSQQLATERERIDALNARIQQLEHMSAARPAVGTFNPDPSLADVSEPKIASTNASPGVGRGPDLPGTFSSPGRNRPRMMSDDPESRATMRAQQKLRLLQLYPDLAAALHLSPAEVDKLFDLLADQQMKTMESREALRDKDLPREQMVEEMRKLNDQQKNDRDKQMAALLGDAKVQEWKDYESSLGARSQVRELKTILEGSGMPLRDDQTQSLVNALVAEQNRYPAQQTSAPNNGGGSPGTFDPTQRAAMLEQNIARLEQQNQRTHDALAPYLTSQQLQRFDELNRQQLDNQRMNLQRIRERAANGFPNRN